MESRQAAAPAWILLTALCLGSPEPGDSKVYYSCGAVMDSLERGLVLSPGFPNRYHRGAHCVWQFIIPVGTQLVMEMLDFDVFESTGEEEPSGLHVKWMSQETTFKDEGETSSPSATSETSFQDVTPPPDPASKPSVLGDPRRGSSGDARMKDASRQMVGEGQLSVMDLAVAAQSRLESTLQAIYHPRRRPENSGQATAKDVGGRSKFAQGTDGRQDKAQGDDDKYLHPQLELTDSTTLSATPWVMDTSPTLLPWADICPQDVLYISDLITFSSRFCGANSPLNKTLVFGSPSEMVEVIMEFITITNRGRGFLMLFEYRNTSGTAAVHVQGHGAAGNLMALAVINGAVFFGVALLATLCLVYRRRLCLKGSRSSSALGEPESGIQNVAVEISELQLVVPPENENNNHSVHRDPTAHAVEQDRPPCMAPEDPSSSVTESGSNEVFIISAGRGASDLDFSTCAVQKDNNLRRSMTSPSSVSDWQTWDPSPAGGDAVNGGKTSPEPDPPRQRTWSTRTFHDFLAPLPTLQKRWWSWSTGSPFTKLVDSGSTAATRNPSQESNRQASSAAQMGDASEPLHLESSYPLSQSGQRQRKVYTSNFKKPRFGSPYFGFRASPADSKHLDRSRVARDPCPLGSPSFGQQRCLDLPNTSSASGARTKDLCMEMEKSKPVFIISEEDDQLPLVLAEQLCPGGDAELVQGSGDFESVGTREETQPAGLGVPEVASDLRIRLSAPQAHRYPYQDPSVLGSSSGTQSSLLVTDIIQSESLLSRKSPFPPCLKPGIGRMSAEPCEHV